MKHKVSDLEDVLLDAAVAKAHGWPVGFENYYPQPETTLLGPFKPSANWAHGGPIIERERIVITPDGDWWCAGLNGGLDGGGDAAPRWSNGWSGPGWVIGATPLIAAMRAFVASKFGDEVDLP